MHGVLQVRHFVIDKADEFSYKDPVDGSVSEHQGIRFLFSDGSRVIFRLSGVASTALLPQPYSKSFPVDVSRTSCVAVVVEL